MHFSQFFASQYRKISLGNISVYQKTSGSEKFYASERGEGVSRFSVESFFCLTVPKISVGGILYCCNNFRYRKSLDKRGGGVSRFSVENFLSHCTEMFHWRTLWCFRKIPLSEIFMHRRGASRFCRNFLSHMTQTKSFVQEPFCFPQIFWYQKNLWIRGGISRFSVEFFYVSQCRKLS